MAPNNQEDGISKNNNMLMFFGAIIYVFNVVFYGYPVYCRITGAPPSDLIERARYFFSVKLFFFASPYVTLLSSMVLIGLFLWGHRKPKTSKYAPPRLMKVLLPVMVRLGVHPEFEYEDTTDKNGLPIKEKKRERIEGQFALSLGIIIILISVLPLMLFSEQSVFYPLGFVLYVAISLLGFAYMILGANFIHSMNKDFGTDDSDANNDLQESFQQCEEKIEDEYSVNLPTQFKYQNKVRNGWINVVNPFRATQVIGTPGSGKSYAVINEFIRQHLAKHFCMYCYDFKFPDLSTIVYNNMRWHREDFRRQYGKAPQFCVINFDDPRKSLRCNPISASFLNEITDAYDSAYTIMLNLNKSWAQKQGEFFVESPINYLTSCIWYLKKVEGGRFCSLPHVVQFVNSQYVDAIPLMSTLPELNNYMAAFFEAWEGGAQDQLQGQIASVRIPLSRISSPELYWVMSGDDFTLDLNNPEEPKILCVGNNPEKKDIYATALGLYNGRIVKIINKKYQHKITLIIDELPTMYFRGLDNLIATARSNKVATVLGFQDFSQLKRDYGDKEATAIINTIGNTFAGLVTGETAKSLESQFGRNKQHRKSVSYNDSGESVSISEQNDLLIPASKIATLSQGNFVGTVSDNFGQEIAEKRFNAKIIIDGKYVKEEERRYQPLPTFKSFDTITVARDLCNETIEFLKATNYLVANNILKSRGLATVSDFEEQLGLGKEIKVNRVIQLLFTQDGTKDYKLADTLANIGKSCLNALMVHEGEVQSAIGKLLSSKSKEKPKEALDLFKSTVISSIDKFSTAIKDYLKEEEQVPSAIADRNFMAFLEEEKNDDKGKKGECKPVRCSIARYKKAVRTTSDYQSFCQDVGKRSKNYISSIREIFGGYANLKKRLQGIRDKEMHRQLDENNERIRRDIEILIVDQLLNLYENHKDLWDRRIKANGLDQNAELARLKAAKEAFQKSKNK